MESPLLSPQTVHAFAGPSSRSRSSTKLDDVTSLTSFPPFEEEDENEPSSYALVTSLFSKVRNSLSAPLSSTAGGVSSQTNHPNASATDLRRPSHGTSQNSQSTLSTRSVPVERPNSLTVVPSNPAPPLVSLTPVVSEAPTFKVFGRDRSPPRQSPYHAPIYESPDGGTMGTAIPGFPIQDDARSIRTTGSLNRSASVSKIIRRIRGEGLSRDYWMDDENCKECYDCKSVFTAWRRKHHCRICGQIFCSRCASNIIKGSRFGHDGMVRICNLCMEKLAKVDDDEDDDHRSIISSAASTFPAHQFGLDSMSIGLGNHPQSPFAASQLFGRTDEPFNLYSIAETKRQRFFEPDDSEFNSRPETPGEISNAIRMWEPVKENPAPFRRALADDEKDGVGVSVATPFTNDDGPVAPGAKTPVDFPIVSASANGTSSIQFPVSSPDQWGSPGSLSMLRSRFNSYADFEVATPFMRSRVHSRMDSFPSIEPGWRTRRESTAYAQELNLTSMFHLRVMLRQMLTDEEIPNIRQWEETLLKLALKIARELTFTAFPQRQGEDMDVRRYVKIKKLPGGQPQDSEYVDGAVITKNVAHKQMSRLQRNPRVMLVTFPLEFHRVEGQYMHFGQIVRQEKEYLGNLASRIAALRPHIVLVEKSVSRLALEALAKQNIAVARAVKPSAINFVSRMTQADVFSSMDKLALEPRLGHSAKFRIQTFDHPLIPGQRKTYMRFEGCSRDMGCTIILRGADIDTLRRIKKVTRFLTFIVRNLKLETHLWKDSVITLRSLNNTAVPASPSTRPPASASSSVPLPSSVSTPRLITLHAKERSAHIDLKMDDEDLPDEDAEQFRLSKRVQESLEPYTKTFISVSATLRFPPPYPIRRMKELDEQLLAAKREWEDEVIRREERTHPAHEQEATVTASTATSVLTAPTTTSSTTESAIEQGDLNAQIEALAVPMMSKTPTPEDGSSGEGADYFSAKAAGTASSTTSPALLLPTSQPSALLSPADELPVKLKSMEDIALESKLSYIKWQHEEQRRIWEWYLRKNSDDFLLEKYQFISLWEYITPIAEFGLHRSCFAPQMKYTTFYGENDCTLGRFIEKAVSDTLVQFLDPKAVCSGRGCSQPLARHCRVYVHNETRLFVAVEQWDGQIIGRSNHPPSDLITTWSACRICGLATPFIPISEEMQRYSFAKFLELHFYPADVQLVQGAGCQHNIYQHHVRYFACRGMTVRFQADPVTLNEIVYPPTRIRIRPETQLELKNADFERLHTRNTLWYTALIDDLKLINIDAATGDEEADARLTAEINALIVRAELEKREVARLTNKIYQESSPTATLALNQVRSYRQDKIVEWQQDFDKLPKPRFLHGTVDKSGRKGSAFNSVRAMWPKRYDLAGTFENPHLPSSSVSEAEEGGSVQRKVTGDSFMSEASEASEPEGNADTMDSEPPVQSDAEQVAHDEGNPAATCLSPSPIPAVHVSDFVKNAPKSDPESDSTVGESKKNMTSLDRPTGSGKATVGASMGGRVSRIPRGSLSKPSVAELVRKYSDYLPAQGVHDLARTALAPGLPVSDTDQEYTTSLQPRPRNKHKHHQSIVRKPSTSDFEQSYAANVAPRYLTQSRRSIGLNNSRIPAPASSFESHQSSRRTSPDKRQASRLIPDSNAAHAEPFPLPGKAGTVGPSVNKIVRRPSYRGGQKDKTPSRPTSSSGGGKSTFRRPTTGPGSKVSNIAKHFERISRDNERANRRYAVIRGKRARPVASARAKVEILDSVKDAIKDESDISDASSEADDEGGGDEEEPKVLGSQLVMTPSPESSLENSATLGQAPPSSSDQNIPIESNVSADSSNKKEEVALDDSRHSTVSLSTTDGDTNQSSSTQSQLQSSTPSLTPPNSDLEGSTGTERHSILKALSGLWPQTFPPPRRTDLESDDPMNDPEHIFRDSSMVVRTDEPTSIIALALNSPQYREMLGRSRAEKRIAREPKLTDSGEIFMPDDRSVAESTSTWGVVNIEVAETANPTDDMRVPSSKQPWAISFESGGLTISCTVLYPEQFDALRRTYDCEKRLIESLSRCVKWDASGGKSGSAFLKTRDDRFIAKELSKAELQTMETFAPAYFEYMSSAVTVNRPTLLAKVFGCYKITFKKSSQEKGTQKSKSSQMNLLVMENLFYDRRFSKIYDLKGSTRNRHVQSTGRENEVLLDENLVETAHLAPFYVREHSKRILRGALYNDSKFLEDINVMDYSLVVGVDSQKNELVVGIVDYVRTYTWDKKLESWVKESAFLGGAGKGEPTIITPRQYRQRFISAMERYFPLVPDRWMKQKDAPDGDPESIQDLWPDW